MTNLKSKMMLRFLTYDNNNDTYQNLYIDSEISALTFSLQVKLISRF